jgi:hypothetical protein
VTFRWKDYARGNKQRTTTWSATEFRRFVQHILPRGFVRIRQFGFLANACRRTLLTLGRKPPRLRPKAPGSLQGRKYELLELSALSSSYGHRAESDCSSVRPAMQFHRQFLILRALLGALTCNVTSASTCGCSHSSCLATCSASLEMSPLHSVQLRFGATPNVVPRFLSVGSTLQQYQPKLAAPYPAAPPAASFKSRYRKCLGLGSRPRLHHSRRGTSDER